MMHSWKNRIGWTSRCLLATAAVAIGTAGATSAHAALTITPPANVIWEFGAPQQGLPTIIITADSNFIGSHAITIVGGGINDKIAEIVVNQEGQAGSELRLDITEIDTFCAITQGPDGTGRYVVDKLETIILGTQTLPLPYTIYAHNIKDVTVALNMYIMMEILDDGDVFESNSQISNVSAVGSEAHFTNEHGPIEVINVRSMTIADIHGLSLNDLTSGTFVKGAVIGDPAVPLGERIMTIEGFFDVGGDFVGTMDVKSIENVSIGGNLDADITVTMPLPADPPLGVNTRSLIIGGTFVAGPVEDRNTITLPALGLASQIIINNESVSGTWVGDVVVGATTLEPGYTDTASSLGNGSIGCVPFALHGADCDPPIDSCVAQSGAPDRTSPIEMRYYGPVKWTGTTDPFKIERRKIDSTDLWIDQSACFDQAMHDTNDTIVVLTPKVASGQSQEELQAGFEYRVTLVQDGSSVNILRCFVTGDPEVADHASEYIFSVDDVNAGDADDNGIVNFADVTSVLSNWVTTDCLALGDADRDGDVDGGDLTSVNANWLNEYDDMCPNCIPEGAAASSPCNRTMRDAMKAMGFNNPGKFARWFGDLDRDERDLVTTGINEWLNCER